MPDKQKYFLDADPIPPDFTWLAKVAQEIKKLGYDEKTAAHFAVLIDEEIIHDEKGNVVVKENGNELAKLKLDLPERSHGTTTN